MTGATLPQQPLDGVALTPLLKGQASNQFDRPLFWHFPAYLQGYSRVDQQRDVLYRTRPVGVVRSGKWKLHEYFEDGDLELYDLGADPGESTNLAESNVAVRDRLYATMKSWRAEIGAPVPTEPNPKYDAAAEAEAAKKLLRQKRK